MTGIAQLMSPLVGNFFLGKNLLRVVNSLTIMTTSAIGPVPVMEVIQEETT